MLGAASNLRQPYNSLKELPQLQLEPKVKPVRRNRLSLPFKDTAASNSLADPKSLLASVVSEEDADLFFVTKDKDGIFKEDAKDDYKEFRRNMRVVFNLVDLTSSDDSGDQSESYGYGQSESEECESSMRDSCASARKRLLTTRRKSKFYEDEQRKRSIAFDEENALW